MKAKPVTQNSIKTKWLKKKKKSHAKSVKFHLHHILVEWKKQSLSGNFDPRKVVVMEEKEDEDRQEGW